jgi:phosphatidate cytidylyltransferase
MDYPKQQEFIKRTVTALIAGTFFFGVLGYAPPTYSSTLLACIMIIGVLEWKQLLRSLAPGWLLVTFLYPLLPFGILILLNQTTQFHHEIYYLLSMVCTHDTAAYLAGSRWGKTLLMPIISPKKTWEGFLGGYGVTCLAFACLGWWRHAVLPLRFIMGFSLLVCGVATAGDLFESWIKRKAGMKDSGILLPGHGGILDRFDGILFAALLFYGLKDYLAQVLK